MVVTTVRGLPPLKGVLFDFGGVLSREGFRGGLYAIARKNGLDPEPFFLLASDVIYDTGYITGRATEADFWAALRRATGIRGTDAELTGEILPRFILRPVMIDAVRSLRRMGYVVAIASDQVDWLERLDERDPFYKEFDRVFNSYRLGKGKRDATVFDDMANALNLEPGSSCSWTTTRETSNGPLPGACTPWWSSNAERTVEELQALPALQGSAL